MCAGILSGRIFHFLCNPAAPSVYVTKCGDVCELVVPEGDTPGTAAGTVHVIFVCAKVLSVLSRTAHSAVHCWPVTALLQPLPVN